MILSICMMVKNEQKYLENCLKSLDTLRKSVDSELIIVDTGSTDNTVEIAKKYTDKVYFHEWNNNFSDMRNITISYAKSKWILIIDADEEIEDAKGMIEFLNAGYRDNYAAGVITMKSIISEGEECDSNSSTIVRLFKVNNNFKFQGAIHESADISGNGFDLKTTFIHYGYLTSNTELMEAKYLRNIGLLKDEVSKNPGSITYRNYLSIQYFQHDEYQKAMEEALAAYNLVKNNPSLQKKYVYIYSQLVECYIKLGKNIEAVRVCEEGLELNDQYIDLHYDLALLKMASQNFDEAIEHFDKYLKLCDNFENLEIRLSFNCKFHTLNRYDIVYINLANIYLHKAQYQKAQEYIDKVSLNDNENNLQRIFEIIIGIYINTKQYKKINEYIEKNLKNRDEAKLDLYLLVLEQYLKLLSEEEKQALNSEIDCANFGSKIGGRQMILSICMMVKNEEKYLENCLKSLDTLRKSVDSELIIVDTGSTDNTVEIAKRYTDKVYFHEWNNNFSDMRNITISYAKGKWVLIIDADEEIEDAKGMIEFLKSNYRDNYVAGAITIKSIILEDKEYGNSCVTIVRLFKNIDGFKFQGAIHENVDLSGRGINLQTTFIHYGYLSSNKELLEAKYWRNIGLLKDEVKKNPNNIMYRNYLSSQYFMHDDYKEALEEALTAYNLVKTTTSTQGESLSIFAQLAICYIKLNKNIEAEKVCIEGLKLNEQHIDLHYYLAVLQTNFQKYDEAIEHFCKYLELCKNYENLEIRLSLFCKFNTLNRYEIVYINLADIYLQKEEYKKAQEYIDKVNMENNENDLKKIFQVIIGIYVKSNQYKKINEYMKKSFQSNDEAKLDLFISTLEEYMQSLDEEEKEELVLELSHGETSYAEFNKIRRLYYDKRENIYAKITDFVKTINLRKMIYGDLIYYLIVLRKPIGEILSKVSEDAIKIYINYMIRQYKNLKKCFVEYLEVYGKNMSFEDVRINKILQEYLLNSNELSDKQYESILKEFINIGCEYVEKIYSAEVLNSHMIFDIKNEQDAFFVYIRLAKKEDGNPAEYLKILRKALEVSPSMSEHIRFLTKEVENQQKVIENSNNQFEQYKAQVKQTISNLIQSGNINDAKLIIEEYKKIVPDDTDIQIIENSLKAVNI